MEELMYMRMGKMAKDLEEWCSSEMKEKCERMEYYWDGRTRNLRNVAEGQNKKLEDMNRKRERQGGIMDLLNKKIEDLEKQVKEQREREKENLEQKIEHYGERLGKVDEIEHYEKHKRDLEKGERGRAHGKGNEKGYIYNGNILPPPAWIAAPKGKNGYRNNNTKCPKGKGGWGWGR